MRLYTKESIKLKKTDILFMMKVKYVTLWVCFFIVYLIIEYFIFTQDKTTRKYRTTVKTVLDKKIDQMTLENINSVHGTPSGILNILYSFQYNQQIMDTEVQTQQGRKKVKDYILQTVDKKEMENLSKIYETNIYAGEEQKRQIAFMLLQGRLYFTFDKIMEKFHTYIHFIHSDTTFAREYIMLNINKYNEAISKRKIIIFRDKFAMIDEELTSTKAKIDKILTDIAIHKDTRRKLVKEVAGIELIRHNRAMDIQTDLFYDQKTSAELVYLLSQGGVNQLIITSAAIFKDNTQYSYIIKNYTLITAGIYAFLTVMSIDFIIRKRKIFKDWLAKQNIS